MSVPPVNFRAPASFRKEAGFPTLLRRVKATSFGRVDFDVKEALRASCAANPGVLLFSTDLPSTRAPRPYTGDDLLLVLEVPGEDLAKKGLYDNAVAFYRPKSIYPEK